jgi:hypothetical protein
MIKNEEENKQSKLTKKKIDKPEVNCQKAQNKVKKNRRYEKRKSVI